MWTFVHRCDHFRTPPARTGHSLSPAHTHLSLQDPVLEVLVQHSMCMRSSRPDPGYRAKVELQVLELLQRVRIAEPLFAAWLEGEIGVLMNCHPEEGVLDDGEAAKG